MEGKSVQGKFDLELQPSKACIVAPDFNLCYLLSLPVVGADSWLGESHLDGATHPLCVPAISGGGYHPHV